MRIKVIIISILLLGAAIYGYVYFSRAKSNSNQPSQSADRVPSIPVTGNPQITTTGTPIVNSGDYTVSWLIVRDSEKISVFANLSDKISSSDAKSKYSCEHILSGGFYSLENKPLGLLIIDGKVIETEIESDLFNGFYTITNNNKVAISYDPYPTNSVKNSIQTGPMLIENGKPLTLVSKSDENARRIAVGKTRKNESVFLAIYSKVSPLAGPKLSELPKIIADLEENTSLEFTNVINLDGGSHSAFLSGNVSLTELARVGTFICIKP